MVAMARRLLLVRLEAAKMRRLHTIPVVVVAVVAVVALSCMNLFRPEAPVVGADPDAWPWASLLLNAAMMNALVHPVLVAVIASRQTDIENTGAGWTLNSTTGVGPGALCRAKTALLVAVLALAVAAETAATIVLARARGYTVPLEWGQWIQYAVLLWLVDGVFVGAHVWLAAKWDNQLICVGVGLLGAFTAMYMFLAPGAIARMVPWGYYAVITNTRLVGRQAGGVRYGSVDLPWVVGFLLLALAALAWATHRMDRVER